MDKRKRAPAATDAEIDFLKGLFLFYDADITTKALDRASLQRKADAWLEIERQFNAVPHHTPKTIAQLRKLLDNMKTKEKKESQKVFEFKQSRLLSGSIDGVKEEQPSIQGTVDSPAKPIINTNGLSQAVQPSCYIPRDGTASPCPSASNDTGYVFVPGNVEVNEGPEEEEYPNGALSDGNGSTAYNWSIGQDAEIERKLRIKRLKLQIDADRQIHKLQIDEAKCKLAAAQALERTALLAKKEKEIRIKIAEEELKKLQTCDCSKRKISYGDN